MGKVGAGQSVFTAPQFEEGLSFGCYVAQPPVSGQFLTGTVHLKVVTEDFNELLRPQGINFVDTDLGAEPVDNNAVLVTPVAQEITAYLLEGIVQAG